MSPSKKVSTQYHSKHRDIATMLQRIQTGSYQAIRASKRPLAQISSRSYATPPPTGAGATADDLLPDPESEQQPTPLSELRETKESAEASSTPLPRARRFQYEESVREIEAKRYHLHIHATRNNTKLTLTNHLHNPVIQSSGGSVGFKKSQRSGYEAGYRAMTSLLEKMNKKGLRPNSLDMTFYGFGQGREAVVSALGAPEWTRIREALTTISDGTKLQFGGCRPPKQRRL